MVEDPSRTKNIRNEYSRILKRLFLDYYKAVKKRMNTVGNETREWNKIFSSVETAVVMDNNLADELVLEFDNLSDIMIVNESYGHVLKYDEIAYTRGKSFAESVLRKNGFGKVGISFDLVDREALEHLNTYNFNLIKDAKNDMVKDIRRVLYDGVRSGKTAKALVPEIKNIFMKLPPSQANLWPNWKNLGREQKMFIRAELIARTEVMRAHSLGSLNRYKASGVKKVQLQTTLKPCQICSDLDGNIYDIDDPNRPEIPVHPLCQCVWLAVF